MSPTRGTELITVLFSPETVPVIDIFRALGDFEEHYSIMTLEQLENQLAQTMSQELAKGIVSDALLLAFGLRRERRSPLGYSTLHSRRGTMDEYRLMAMMGATYWHDFTLAAEVAALLDVTHPQPLISLSFDIARRLEAAGLRLDEPDARILKVQEPLTGTSRKL